MKPPQASKQTGPGLPWRHCPWLIAAGLLMSAGAACCLGQTPESKRPVAPPVPREASDQERDSMVHSAMLLAQGQFQQASPLLKALSIPPVVHVWVDWSPVPTAMRLVYQRAIGQALQAWSQALAGVARFQLASADERADLQVLFQRDVALVTSGQARLACIDTHLDLPGTAGVSKRTGVAWVALNVPYTSDPHTAASIGHLVGQAVGVYLGLATVDSGLDLMGPDSHAYAVSTKPSPQDVHAARQLQHACVLLAGFAARRETVVVHTPVMALDKTVADAGNVAPGDTPHFVFTVKNTGSAPLEITAKPNCGCVIPRYDPVIAPGAEGKIEAQLRTSGYRGSVIKLINVTSNDLGHANVQLRLMANIESLLQVLPSDTPIVPLNENGDTVQDLELRLRGNPPAEITRLACTAPYASATLAPGSLSGDTRTYHVHVTIHKGAPAGRSAFIITAFMTSTREPQANITVICDKGALVIPQSVYMGAIDSRSVLPVDQVVTLLKHSGPFHILKLESDDPHLEVTYETLQEGLQYRIHLRYLGGWPAGAIRSTVTVLTDDPAEPTIVIPVTASVAAGGAAAR